MKKTILVVLALVMLTLINAKVKEKYAMEKLANLYQAKNSVTAVIVRSDDKIIFYTDNQKIKDALEPAPGLMRKEICDREIKWLIERNYNIIDADMLDSILAEQQITLSSYITPEMAKQIGWLTGAQYILFMFGNGVLTFTGPGLIAGAKMHYYDNLSVKLINASTGQLVDTGVLHYSVDSNWSNWRKKWIDENESWN